MKKIIAIILVLVLTLSMFASCGGSTNGLKADASLTIKGTGIEATYSAEQMGKLKLLDIKCKNISSSGETKEVTAKGFSVKDILSENGLNLSDSSSVNLIASDGYIMNASVEEYVDSDIYVLLQMDGENLETPRSCIPDKRSMYWVKNLSKIELVFEGVRDGSEVSEISFFSEGKTQITAKKIDNRGVKVEAYSLKTYFEKAFGKTQTESLKMIAKDGFEKSETAEVFFKNFVTTAADTLEAPLYFGEISDGMRVKGLDFVVGNGVAVYFGEQISVPLLFKKVGMKKAAKYQFVASDGMKFDVAAEALEFGKIFFDTEKKCLRASFDGFDFGDVKGGGKVKYLLKVTAI